MLSLKNRWKKTRLPEVLITLAVLSAFVNAIATAVLAIGVTVYLFCNEDRRDRLLSVPHARWLLPFAALALTIPALWGNWIGVLVGFLVVCFLCLILYLTTHMTPALQRRLLALVCLLSVPAALIAFVQRYALGVERVSSLFWNPNYYAAALEFVLLIAANQLLNRKGRWERVYLLSLLVVNLVALDATGCRSAWLALLIGMVALLALNRKPLQSVLVLMGGAAALYLSTVVPDLLPRMAHLGPAADVRVDIWRQALSYIHDNPLFGAGAMAYYDLSAGAYPHAHNLYLDMMLNYGLVGCLMLAGFLLPLFRGALRGLVSTRTAGSPYALLFAATAALLTHGLTDVTILWPQTALLFSLLLSCSAFQHMPVVMLPPLPLPDAAKQTAYRLPH